MMQMLAAVQWAHPWAWLLGLAPLALGWRSRRARRLRETAAYADPALRDWAVREGGGRGGAARRWLEALTWLLLAAALAGPRRMLTLDHAGVARLRHRVDVLVLLELPRQRGGSAVALERQRIALQDLQSRLHGERLGLMVFAAGSGLLLPCTSDPSLFDAYLDHARAGLLAGTRGPGLPGALALARRELLREGGRSRALLLLAGASATRSLDPRGRAALREQALALRAARIPVYLAWSGPGRPGPLLRRLVRGSAGARARLDRPGLWATLYDRGIAGLPSDPPTRSSLRVWQELYAWPLFGALLALLLLEAGPRLPRGRAALPLLLGAALACGALHPSPARAAGTDPGWQAWQAWRHRDYARCAGLYARLHGFDARLGEGDCDYRRARYQQAVRAYRGAMLRAGSDRDRALALYNLGNAAFHVEGGLREALDAYRASLVLWPADPAALRNLRLAQAQWAQEHPERAIVGMGKRGAPAAGGRFGDTSDATPSQLRRKRRQRPLRYRNERLQAAGRLQAAHRGGADRAAGASLSVAEIAAARRGVQLLRDHRAGLLGGLIERDSREAARLAGSP